MKKSVCFGSTFLTGAVVTVVILAAPSGCGGPSKSAGDASDADHEDAPEVLDGWEDAEMIPDAETDEDAEEDTVPVDPCVYESDGGCPPEDFTAAATCGLEGEECRCVLSGTYTEDLRLTPDVTWILSGSVSIGDGAEGDGHQATLTVLPGTLILGESATRGLLAVTMHSRIEAGGDARCPIVFTSDRPAGSRARGDWGGVTINGRSTVNICLEPPCVGESPAGMFGGDVEDDDSGTLRYVRIEFGGHRESSLLNHNGLSLWGVGSGTDIEFVQIHMAGDDGLQFFGGTADFRHVLVTGTLGDSLDWTYGWRGKGQFFVSQHYGDQSSSGIEGSSLNVVLPDLGSPRSHPVLSNLTLVSDVPDDPMYYRVAIVLQESTAANISCAAVLNMEGACLDIDDADTYSNAWDEADGALSGELTLDYSVMSCATAYFDDGEPSPPFTLQEFYETLNTGNELYGTETDVLTAPFDYGAPDFTPLADGPAAGGCTTPEDPFFERVSYRGGVGPDDDWTALWTTREAN